MNVTSHKTKLYNSFAERLNALLVDNKGTKPGTFSFNDLNWLFATLFSYHCIREDYIRCPDGIICFLFKKRMWKVEHEFSGNTKFSTF